MTIPLEIIVAILGAIIGFVFKVVFGLIAKNDDECNKAEERIEKTIKEMDDRYRSNDRELYQKVADANVNTAKIQAQIDCMKDKA